MTQHPTDEAKKRAEALEGFPLVWFNHDTEEYECKTDEAAKWFVTHHKEILSALQAQGRTQSAVPDENTLDELVMLIARLIHKSRNVPEMADLRATTLDYLARKNLTPSPLRDLSAAPPVTGGAWLPIESAPKDGDIVLVSWPTGEFQRAKYLVNEQGRGDFWFESSRGRHLVNKIGFTHWMIPAPPSSAEKDK